MPRKQTKRIASSVDLDQVERLASLSRLSLDAREADRLRGELSAILDYFATLDKLEVSAVQPQAVPEGGTRKDVVEPSDADAILEGVPQRKGRFVRAPRVF